jgi:hypothetical protein
MTCYALRMSDERTNAALARIDAALRRIETAASRDQTPLDQNALADRHAALRAKTGDALQALNALIADEEKR